MRAAVIYLLLSLGLVVGGIVWWRHDVSRLREHGVETQALSVGAWKKTKGSSVSYTSILHYDDQAHVNHSISVEGVITEGSYGTIVYDPDNPENAVLKSDLHAFMWPKTWPGILVTVGVIWAFALLKGGLKE